MIDLLNLSMLGLILFCVIASVLRRDRILWALYLVGLTQIGEIYPVLGKIRFELILGVVSLVYVMLTQRGLTALSPAKSPITKYLLFFVIAAALSIPFSVDPGESSFWFGYYAKRCWILFLLAAALLDTEQKIRQFVVIYLIGSAWLALTAATQYLLGVNVVEVDGVERVRGATGILSNPNGLANTLVQSLPFIYYFFAYKKNALPKFLIAAIGVVSLSAVFFSGSRGGFYGLVCSLFILSMFSKRRTSAIMVSLIILTGALALAGPALLGRYSTILDPGDLGSSGESRIWGLRHGISMFLRRPILGVGLGCYAVARSEWFNWTLWAHNHFGQLIGELGFLGTASWFLMIYWTVKSVRALRKQLESKGSAGSLPFGYYLSLAIETAIYIRLILGMSTHSLHISFWYLFAGVVVAYQNVCGRDVQAPKGNTQR